MVRFSWAFPHQFAVLPGDTDRLGDLDRNRERMVTFATRRAMREFPVLSPAVAAAVTPRRKLYP